MATKNRNQNVADVNKNDQCDANCNDGDEIGIHYRMINNETMILIKLGIRKKQRQQSVNGALYYYYYDYDYDYYYDYDNYDNENENDNKTNTNKTKGLSSWVASMNVALLLLLLLLLLL